MADSKGKRVHAYPDMFFGEQKLSVSIVQYDAVFYGFGFVKNLDTQVVSKITIASKKKTVEHCRLICEDYIKRREEEGWKDPFYAIHEEQEKKKLINFLDKYG